MATRKEQHVNGLDDSLIVLAVDDGTHGHYVTVAMPQWDGSAEMQTALRVGLNYDALRKAQSVAKKAAKEGKNVSEALAEFAASFKPEANADRVTTVGSERARIASELLRARLSELGKPTNDATIAANLPAYMSKYADKVDSALHSYLVGGYTPSRKGEGKAAGESGAVVVDDL